MPTRIEPGSPDEPARLASRIAELDHAVKSHRYALEIAEAELTAHRTRLAAIEEERILAVLSGVLDDAGVIATLNHASGGGATGVVRLTPDPDVPGSLPYFENLARGLGRPPTPPVEAPVNALLSYLNLAAGDLA